MNNFTIIVNAGRSGSSFLADALRTAYLDKVYVAHEDIPVQVSKPRTFNRAYETEDYESCINDKMLLPYLERWKAMLAEKPVIETGWTAYHLLPVLNRWFEGRMRYVILHRHPVSFALSRANMGNYHKATSYDDAHEVSPYDHRSIAPEKAVQWGAMNHFEKSLFWWYVVYREAYEFKEKQPDVPVIELPANRLFTGQWHDYIGDFIGAPIKHSSPALSSRNENYSFARETYPIRDEWKMYTQHQDIIRFAQDLGYQFDSMAIEEESKKYMLPSGAGPWVRHHLRYWRTKAYLGKLARRFC
jgi:hypothetical protein